MGQIRLMDIATYRINRPRGHFSENKGEKENKVKKKSNGGSFLSKREVVNFQLLYTCIFDKLTPKMSEFLVKLRPLTNLPLCFQQK